MLTSCCVPGPQEKSGTGLVSDTSHPPAPASPPSPAPRRGSPEMSWEANRWASAEQSRGMGSRADEWRQVLIVLRGLLRKTSLSRFHTGVAHYKKGKGKRNSPHSSSSEGCIQQRKINFLRKLMLRGCEDAKWAQKPRQSSGPN